MGPVGAAISLFYGVLEGFSKLRVPVGGPCNAYLSFWVSISEPPLFVPCLGQHGVYVD